MRHRSNPGSARPVTVDWSYFGVVIGATFASHVHTEPEFESICTPQFLPDTCIGAHGRNHQTTTRSVSHFFFFVGQDHAFAGIGAGTVAVLCMNPLDLLKVKFQVSTSVRAPGGGMGRGIWFALRDIHASEGWRGLYRGLGPNVAGNASSWGLYFLLLRVFFFLSRFSPALTFVASYNQLKRRATVGSPDRPLSASQYLLYSAEASSHLLLLWSHLV